MKMTTNMGPNHSFLKGNTNHRKMTKPKFVVRISDGELLDKISETSKNLEALGEEFRDWQKIGRGLEKQQSALKSEILALYQLWRKLKKQGEEVTKK